MLIFGRDRVPRWAYFLACLMVSIGTSLSAYWIMVNNSWMQYPTGYSLTANGVFVPDDWPAILFSEAVRTRFPHMVLAAYVTSAFCVAATGAWYMLRGTAVQEGRAMAVMGLRLAAILVPLQLLFGHLVGDYVHDRQPAKFAAIEGRWNDQQPASEILIAWPDPKNERNLFEIAVPYLGSIIGSMSLTPRRSASRASRPRTGRRSPSPSSRSASWSAAAC